MKKKYHVIYNDNYDNDYDRVRVRVIMWYIDITRIYKYIYKRIIDVFIYYEYLGKENRFGS
jgi:hypothetical protein